MSNQKARNLEINSKGADLGPLNDSGQRMQIGFLDNDLIEDGIAMCVFPGIPYWIWIGSSKYLTHPDREECRNTEDLWWMVGCISHETLHDVLNRLQERKASRMLDTWIPDGRYRRSGLGCDQASAIAAWAYDGGKSFAYP
jgi:hypothetical protein